MDNNNVLLKVRNLSKYYEVGGKGLFKRGPSQKVRAVDNISFNIYDGETLGLVGESGSGKTTVGRTLLRIYEPDNGKVLYKIGSDEDVEINSLKSSELKHFRRNIQMVFQDPFSSLNPRMTVRNIIAEPLVIHGIAKGKELDRRVEETARRCKLNIEHLSRYPHAFSGGQRQRIGIARALVLNPKFIVCDEAVSALDVSVQAEICNLLSELQEEMKLTYLFIAHDLSVVEHISTRVAVMYLGKIVELAPSKELFFNPKHPYTEALMSVIPMPEPSVEMKPVMLKGEIGSAINPPSGCYFHPRCSYAKDICKTTAPEWREIKPGHFCSCHFAKSLELQGASAME